MMKWTKVSERNPDKNGEYIVATRYEVTPMNYTTLCGWNTSRMHDGSIDGQYAMSDDRIVAWMPFPDYPQELRDAKEDETWQQQRKAI